MTDPLDDILYLHAKSCPRMASFPRDWPWIVKHWSSPQAPCCKKLKFRFRDQPKAFQKAYLELVRVTRAHSPEAPR